jgi:short-subunit dehydrogenase
LVLAAEDERVRAVAAELDGAEAVQVDLAMSEGVEQLHARLLDRPVDVLALNAGITAGDDLERELRLVDLNVRSVVHLARLELPRMIERGAGRVLLTSSIAAGMPGPYQPAYNASKAFVQSYGLALREELRGTGVTMTLLMPGPTETGIFARAGQLDTWLGRTQLKDDPADVADDAFRAVMDGRERVVSSSWRAKLVNATARVLPDDVKARLAGLVSRPRG